MRAGSAPPNFAPDSDEGQAYIAAAMSRIDAAVALAPSAVVATDATQAALPSSADFLAAVTCASIVR